MDGGGGGLIRLARLSKEPGGTDGGHGGGMGGYGVCSGGSASMRSLGPQSTQSVPYGQEDHCAPAPPSSQVVSLASGQLLKQSVPQSNRGPQSLQSVPSGQRLYLLPSPPSSHTPSSLRPHVSEHRYSGAAQHS